MPEIKVGQEEIQVGKTTFYVTRIPTATSGSWFTVHDACEIWGAVAINDLTGESIGWKNPPDERYRSEIEQKVKNAFGIPDST